MCNNEIIEKDLNRLIYKYLLDSQNLALTINFSCHNSIKIEIDYLRFVYEDEFHNPTETQFIILLNEEDLHILKNENKLRAYTPNTNGYLDFHNHFNIPLKRLELLAKDFFTLTLYRKKTFNNDVLLEKQKLTKSRLKPVELNLSINKHLYFQMFLSRVNYRESDFDTFVNELKKLEIKYSIKVDYSELICQQGLLINQKDNHLNNEYRFVWNKRNLNNIQFIEIPLNFKPDNINIYYPEIRISNYSQ